MLIRKSTFKTYNRKDGNFVLDEDIDKPIFATHFWKLQRGTLGEYEGTVTMPSTCQRIVCLVGRPELETAI